MSNDQEKKKKNCHLLNDGVIVFLYYCHYDFINRKDNFINKRVYND